MKKAQQDLARLYQIPGYEQPNPNTIQEAVSDYIENMIVEPLRKRNSECSPTVQQEAQTVAYNVAGFAYNQGHEAGWNEALSFVNHLSGAFITDDENVQEYDTIVDINGTPKGIVKAY